MMFVPDENRDLQAWLTRHSSEMSESETSDLLRRCKRDGMSPYRKHNFQSALYGAGLYGAFAYNSTSSISDAQRDLSDKKKDIDEQREAIALQIAKLERADDNGVLPSEIILKNTELERLREQNYELIRTLFKIEAALGNLPEGFNNYLYAEPKPIDGEQETKTKPRELTQWLQATWIKESKPGGTAFFTALKKYVNGKGSPIVEHYDAGTDAGFRWRTSAGTTGTMAKKTVLTKVSAFKKTS